MTKAMRLAMNEITDKAIHFRILAEEVFPPFKDKIDAADRRIHQRWSPKKRQQLTQLRSNLATSRLLLLKPGGVGGWMAFVEV
jgi:hypothetical protein